MAKGRWIFTPMTAKRIGRRKTLADRYRAWRIRMTQETPDVFMVTGYYEALRPARRG